jgi:hypothetical protein
LYIEKVELNKGKMNKINKNMLKETLAQYKALDTHEFHRKIRDAGKKNLLQKWREYLTIMDFGLKIKPVPSINEQKQKIEMLNDYYEKIKLFETRKSRVGKSD